jgi:hypothetical protein
MDPLIERINLSSPVVTFNPGATQAFVEQAVERRQAATDRAQEMLDRIQSRAQQLTDRAAATTTTWPTLAQWDKQLGPSAVSSPGTSAADERESDTRARDVDANAATALAAQVMSTPVLLREETTDGSPVYAAVAKMLEVPLFELWPDQLGRAAFYGRLVRRGRSVMTDVGAFPKALSGPGLVVVHGGLYPSTIERLKMGYCDIPGTRSTTRVHEDARVIVVPT